uniref:protein O-GlcNAcase n=1 Tax=Sinocyclocheilus grahami TaxID=75366 RepID=A0A672QW85_SINGR
MVQKDKIIESTQSDSEADPVPSEAVADTQCPVDEPSIGVERTGRRKFITGVVEGFYGRPWTMEQRKELFRRQQKWGLNTYLYAPKDDYKHRMFWREMYSVEEADQLTTLISAAEEHGIEFIYAISPGLDITFSNQKEVSTLKRKLDQVSHFGCKSFALLFDDIDHNMCPADKEVFSSFAHAQVSITNEIFQYLGEPEIFVFCPTEYCGTFCYPNVSQSPYLRTIGEKLLPGIEVLWTGPKVVSKDITVESIEEVTKILRRAPVIWDNIHANDYDQKRLFLGPYKGRSTELIPRLKGVLTNPNCEFESNFVAIHTLATWYKSNMNGVRKDVVMTDSEDSTVSIQIKLENEGSDEELDTDILYSPQIALKLALTEWLSEFGVPHQYNSRQVPHSGTKSTSIDVPALTVPSLGTSTTVTTVFQQPIMSPNVPLSDELLVLGKEEEVEVEVEKKESDEEPMEMVVEKHDEVEDTKNVNQILTEIVKAKMTEDLRPMDTDKESLTESKSPEMSIQEDSGSDIAPMQTDDQLNKEVFVPGPNEKPLFTAEPLTLEDLTLLAELFYLPYEHGPKAVQMLKEFNWLRANSNYVSVNANAKDPEKVAEWQSRAENFEEMCCSVIQMFTRLSNSANRTILYDLYPYIWDIKSIISMVKSFVQWLDGRIFSTSFYCYRMDSAQWCRSQSSAQFLSGDQEPWAFRGGLAGEFQRLLPIDGANDLFYQPPPPMPTSKIYTLRPYFPKDEVGFGWKMMLSFHEEEEEGLPESFLSNFPSLIKVDIHAKVTDPSVAKSMMGCLLSSLKANGSHGAFCEVRQMDKRMLDFYSKLGCFEVAKMEGFPKDVIIMGRSL